MAEASSSATYVLVTGGAGFIGSHTVLELLKQGYKCVVVDNLCNSSDIPLRRVEELGLRGVFRQYKFSSVIHFAALKAVGESVRKPLNYYRNNITGTLNLLDVMIEFDVKNIVFSSSATVYKADPEGKPLREDSPLGCTNPYGRTKLYMESIIRDVTDAEHGWNAIMLRYFNPTGAH
ncbi:NAD(P)-binding protein, partial [Linderina pennispora]